jgi:GAF domain-containing protein/HPt (histidine-containing phosphotransfer) domain-containing protein
MDSTLLDQIRHLCRDRAAYEHLKAILVQQERVHQLSWEEEYAKLLATSEAQGTDAFSNIIAREKALAQLAEAMQRSPSLDLVLQIAVQSAQKLLQVDRVAIFRHYPDGLGEFITDAIATGVTSLAEMPERQHSLTRHIIESTQIEDSVQIFNSINNSSLSTHSINLLEQIGIASYAANKIYAGQELWGTIIAFHSSNYHGWSEVDRTSLALISAQIGIAIALSNLRQQSQSLAHDLQVLQLEVNNLQQTVKEIADAEIAKAEVNEDYISEAHISEIAVNEAIEQINSPILVSTVPVIESNPEAIPETKHEAIHEPIPEPIPESIIDTVLHYLVDNDLQNNSIISDRESSNLQLNAEHLELNEEEQNIKDEEPSQSEEALEIIETPSQDLFDTLEQPDEYFLIDQNSLTQTFLVPDSHADLSDIEPEDIQPEDIPEEILVIVPEEDKNLELVEEPTEEWELDDQSEEFTEDAIATASNTLEDSSPAVYLDVAPNDLDPVIEPQFIETILMLAGNGQKAIEFLINVIDTYLQDAPNLLWEIDRAITIKDRAQILQSLNSLRSSSDYVGALILSQECRRLEAAVKADNVSLIHTCLSQLESEVERATEALRIERSRYT